MGGPIKRVQDQVEYQSIWGCSVIREYRSLPNLCLPIKWPLPHGMDTKIMQQKSSAAFTCLKELLQFPNVLIHTENIKSLKSTTLLIPLWNHVLTLKSWKRLPQWGRGEEFLCESFKTSVSGRASFAKAMAIYNISSIVLTNNSFMYFKRIHTFCLHQLEYIRL